MTTTQHTIAKPAKLAATAVGMLEDELIVPNLMTKKGIDEYKGSDNDTISVPVEGVLPFHDYAWRNDRTNPIVFDTYAERKIAVTFGGNVYNAVKLTDEQNDMDLHGWAKLLTPQVKAVARGLGRRAVNTLTGQTYNCVIGDSAANLIGALIEARRVLNKFHAPADNRYLLVGTDFEGALLSEPKLNLAQNVGDATAVAALENATIGRKYGFTIVVDQTIPADAAYAFAGSAFIFLSAAPSVPQSAPFGATTAFEDIALRWIRDYDPTYMQDRSVVNTYAGFQSVLDVLVGWDNTNQTEVVTTSQYFVRGVKLVLDGASYYPPTTGTTADKELGALTGVTGPGKHLIGTATGTVADD